MPDRFAVDAESVREGLECQGLDIELPGGLDDALPGQPGALANRASGRRCVSRPRHVVFPTPNVLTTQLRKPTLQIAGFRSGTCECAGTVEHRPSRQMISLRGGP